MAARGRRRTVGPVTPTRRLTALGTLLAVVLTLGGCSRVQHPGPGSVAVRATTATALLTTSRLDHLDTPGWTAVTGAARYLPAPCGTTVAGINDQKDAVATWRNGSAVVQVQVARFDSAEVATGVAHDDHAVAVRCVSWLETGTTWTSTPLTAPVGHPKAVVSRSVTQLSAGVQRRYAWAVTSTGADLVTVAVSTLGTGSGTRAAALLRALYPGLAAAAAVAASKHN